MAEAQESNNGCTAHCDANEAPPPSNLQVQAEPDLKALQTPFTPYLIQQMYLLPFLPLGDDLDRILSHTLLPERRRNIQPADLTRFLLRPRCAPDLARPTLYDPIKHPICELMAPPYDFDPLLLAPLYRFSPPVHLLPSLDDLDELLSLTATVPDIPNLGQDVNVPSAAAQADGTSALPPSQHHGESAGLSAAEGSDNSEKWDEFLVYDPDDEPGLADNPANRKKDTGDDDAGPSTRET